MEKRYKIILSLFLGAVNCLCSYTLVKGQQYYKFPVVEEGVYRLSQDQASAWGLGDIEEISVLGRAGMLDQKIDSSIFAPEEVPQKKIGDKLYFFLGEADEMLLSEGEATLQENHYTDTLFYLLKTGHAPQNPVLPETESNASSGELHPPKHLFQLIQHKIEENNLLSSGRDWYGYRTFNGGSQSIILNQVATSTDGPVAVWARVMAQSFAESKFTFAANNQVIGEITIPSIPNSRYAVKGREGSFYSTYPKPSGHNTQEIILTFTSDNPNGTGYLKDLLLGFPFMSSQLPEGVYYNPDPEPFQLGTSLSGLWDVSNFYEVKELKTNQPILSHARKIVVFDPDKTDEIPVPEPVKGRHELLSGEPELIIITSALLEAQAERLAAFKNHRGLPTEVVLTADIFDSFGYGNPDISSIRNFLASHWQESQNLKNVLFFGKGSFDYKHKLGGRPNLVPTYSSRESLNPLTTYGSDDYFGFLEIGDGEWLENQEGDDQLQIGLGRIPAINSREAKIAVDKIITYQSGNPGNWKKKLLFVADDGDNNLHLNDSEKHTAYLYDQSPEFELKKLYLDNYPQDQHNNEQTATIAKEVLNKEIKEGLLLLNYIGHGNELNLTAEGLFSVSDIADWPVTRRYPVIVTATCEFGRHDSPYIRSGAEELLLAEQKGAIAVLTTGRPVFSSSNYSLNKAFIEAAFNGNHSLTLGEIFSVTKNNSLNGSLNRNFSLLGDPSLRLDLPLYEATTREWIKVDTDVETDSLTGLHRLAYHGSVNDPLTQAAITQFDGSFEIIINGPPGLKETLGDENPKTNFIDYNQPLFRGSGEVHKGIFSGEVLLPELKNYSNGDLLISVFAIHDDLSKEAYGASTIPLNPTPSRVDPEEEGPVINLWIADSLQSKSTISFRNTPAWISLYDDSGIKINDPSGITLQLNDGDILSLTAAYMAIDGGFREGIIKTRIDGLKEGMNKLVVTAYDQQGNSTEITELIEVIGSNQIRIENLMVYPNPAKDHAHFKIAHNRPGETLRLLIKIFSLQGIEIFSYEQRFPKVERSIIDIQWIFLNSKSKNLVKGTYLYNLNLYSEADATADILAGKIIIQ
jgi:hypothetical protein